MKIIFKKIRSGFRVYKKHLAMNFRSGLEYKGWWMMVIQTAFAVVTDPLSTILLFSRFGNIGEWRVEHILLVYSLAVCSFGLAECFMRGFDYFPWSMLRSGSFDRLLLRPCSLFIQVASSAFHIHRIARPFTALAAVLWSLSRLGFPDAIGIAVLLLAIIGGFLLYCGVFVMTSGIAFFTIKGLDWIYIVTNASYQLNRCPEPYMPRLLWGFFTFLIPVLAVSFYPAATALKWNYPPIYGWFALPAGVLFLLLSLVVWRIGVKHYKSTGS